MKRSRVLEELEAISADPHIRLRGDYGKPVVGYFCTYVPEELIHASGAIPVRLFKGLTPSRGAGRYMQNFCCSFARSLLEGILAGNYGYMAAIIMPHTCDTMRNLTDIVESADTGIRVIPLPVPTATRGSAAELFASLGFRSLKGELEELISVNIAAESLAESIALYNRCRRVLAGLWDLGLSNYQAYTLFLAAQLMDKEEFLALAGDIPKQENKTNGKLQVALYGGPLPEAAFFAFLDECGIRVVWDSLCTASRYGGIEVALPAGEDPMDALVKRYLHRVPCPTKLDLHGIREEELVRGVKATRAEAVLFMPQQFCEFHAFDYPALKERLDREGIPSLKIPLEYPYQPSGRERTRLQAFQEMVGGKGVSR